MKKQDKTKKKKNAPPEQNDSISIKLSALHPRYEWTQQPRIDTELYPTLLQLCQQAANHNIGLCIDAEESWRLNITLNILEKLCHEPTLKNWQGLGIAIQAYQKRAIAITDYIIDLAQTTNMRLMPRLVKGAYWDSEIKWAQEGGYQNYPVYTEKAHTDLSYQICADKLIKAGESIYPCIGTHNAQTLATIITTYPTQTYELQNLHNMAPAIQKTITETHPNIPSRTYAPIGPHQTLLPYLIRRLLENGANTSYLNQLTNPNTPIQTLTTDPITTIQTYKTKPLLTRPPKLYTNRKNSQGHDLTNPTTRNKIQTEIIKNLPTNPHHNPTKQRQKTNHNQPSQHQRHNRGGDQRKPRPSPTSPRNSLPKLPKMEPNKQPITFSTPTKRLKP